MRECQRQGEASRVTQQEGKSKTGSLTAVLGIYTVRPFLALVVDDRQRHCCIWSYTCLRLIFVAFPTVPVLFSLTLTILILIVVIRISVLLLIIFPIVLIILLLSSNVLFILLISLAIIIVALYISISVGIAILLVVFVICSVTLRYPKVLPLILVPLAIPLPYRPYTCQSYVMNGKLTSSSSIFSSSSKSSSSSSSLRILRTSHTSVRVYLCQTSALGLVKARLNA